MMPAASTDTKPADYLMMMYLVCIWHGAEFFDVRDNHA